MVNVTKKTKTIITNIILIGPLLTISILAISIYSISRVSNNTINYKPDEIRYYTKGKSNIPYIEVFYENKDNKVVKYDAPVEYIEIHNEKTIITEESAILNSKSVTQHLILSKDDYINAVGKVNYQQLNANSKKSEGSLAK